MNDFISNLAPDIEDFIKFKRSLGIQYKTSSYYLKQLDRYNHEHGNYSELRKMSLKAGPCYMHVNPLRVTGVGYLH